MYVYLCVYCIYIIDIYMYVYIFRYLCIYINIYDMCFKSFLHIIFINTVFHQLIISHLLGQSTVSKFQSLVQRVMI